MSSQPPIREPFLTLWPIRILGLNRTLDLLLGAHLAFEGITIKIVASELPQCLSKTCYSFVSFTKFPYMNLTKGLMCNKVKGNTKEELILEIFKGVHVHFKEFTNMLQKEQPFREARVNILHQDMEYMKEQNQCM